MTNRKRSTQSNIKKQNRTFPPGYVAPKRKELPARLGLKRWLIKAASNDQPVVVIDAVGEDEAIQRAHMMRTALQNLEVWPTLSLVYAEEYGDGPVCITWFREGLFLAINDLRQPDR